MIFESRVAQLLNQPHSFWDSRLGVLLGAQGGHLPLIKCLQACRHLAQILGSPIPQRLCLMKGQGSHLQHLLGFLHRGFTLLAGVWALMPCQCALMSRVESSLGDC